MIEGYLNPKDFKRLMKKLNSISPKERGNILVRAFRKASQYVEMQLKNVALKGKILKRRTGHLAKSIEHEVKVYPQNIIATIGSGVRQKERIPYANIHETGGKITAKNGGWLVIPIRAGSTEAIGMGLSKKPMGSSSKVLSFRKVKSVTIPARKYLSKTLASSKRKIDSLFIKEIQRGLSS